MARNGDEVMFCTPCAPSGEYGGIDAHLRPENLRIDTSNFGGSSSEVIVFFSTSRPEGMAPDVSGDDHYVSESIGDIYPNTHPLIKGIERAIHTDGLADTETRIGRAFCEKIGKCVGEELTDAGYICPAFNNMELRKLF